MTGALAFAALAGALAAFVLPPPYGASLLWLIVGTAIAILAALVAANSLRPGPHGGGVRRGVAAHGLTFLLALLWVGLHVHAQVELRWPLERDGERALVQARITSIPVLREYGWTFDAIATPLAATFGEPRRVRVTWRSAPEAPEVGHEWRLLIRLRPARAALNPGGPDMERHWFRERLHALATVVPSRLNERLGASPAGIDRTRARIAAAIERLVPGRDAAALYAALVVGVTGEMTREQWRVFNATGTTHLVAISGLHVTMFAVAAMFAARWLWRLGPAWLRRRPRDPSAAAFGVAAATGYAWLAGFSVPTQRTLIMLAAWLFVASLARARSAGHAYATALVLVLLVDPFAPLASGFWLSFGAVAALLAAAAVRFHERSRHHEIWRMQLIVGVALAPLTLAWFGGISLVSFVVNLLAIPIFTLVLVPLALLATLLLAVSSAAAEPLWRLAGALYELGWPWLERAADLPYALVSYAPPPWWYGLAIAGAVVAFMPMGPAWRATAALVLVPLLGAGRGAGTPDGAYVTALDVGTGQAIVLRAGSRTLVYGTGESYRTDGRRTEAVLLPALRRAGVSKVDRVIVPRLDRDAAAGVAALLVSMDIGEVVTGTPWIGAALRTSLCEPGDSWALGGATIEILAAGSCTLLVRTADTSLLIAASLGREGYRELGALAAARDDLRADVVLVSRIAVRDMAGVRELARLEPRRLVLTSATAGRSAGVSEAIATACAEVSLDCTSVTGAGAMRIELDRGEGALPGSAMRGRHPWPWRHGPV